MAAPSIAFKLSPESEGPVYRQIATAIREAIDGGRLTVGDRLPAIRRLATDLGVHRDTVALAYEALGREGYVESTVGRGTFVRALGARPAPVAMAPRLTAEVERLLAFENARTRFGDETDVVDMHALVPDPAFYPVDDFRRAVSRAVNKGGADLFLYGEAQGHRGLRASLAQRFGAMGIDVGADEIVLTHGASQGIALALRLFASSGDRVAVEVPTYHNVLAALASLGLSPVPVPMRASGPDLEVLERVLSEPDVKAFYTIPTFHNPMGISTSLLARRGLLDVARRTGKPVIEDAFEMDLRVSGSPVAPLAALDDSGFVVLLHSFSKSLFPGLRVGSVVARGACVDGLVALKHATDLSDSPLLQASLAEFIEDGAYDRHLGRIRRELRARFEAVDRALSDHLPQGTEWTRPEGGYQIWVELPFAIDTRDLLADASRAGVLFSPGAHFLPDGGASRCLRLTVARAGVEKIDSGLRALGELVTARQAGEVQARRSPGVLL